MITLSINEGINSSVVVADGPNIKFALQEERISREKEFTGFPKKALRFTLSHLNLDPKNIDAVCFSNNISPLRTKEKYHEGFKKKEDTILQSLLKGEFETGARRAYHYLPWLIKIRGSSNPLQTNVVIDGNLLEFNLVNTRVLRTHHHLNHAASAYFGLREDDNPYLVLTLDGEGDGDCANVYIGEKGKLKLISRTPAGHSLGQIYSRVTYYLGMTPHEHEYKVMGMAPYADPKYATPVMEMLKSYLWLDPDNPMVFQRRIRETTSYIYARLVRDFKRIRFDSIAGGVQLFTEAIILTWIKACIEATGINRILCAGGVFMNVKANKLIAEMDGITSFDVFPSCGDETLPFGTAWLAASKFGHPPPPNSLDSLYLGPDGGYDIDCLTENDLNGIDQEIVEDPLTKTVELLTAGEIVARCSGRMEFGARALGNRSLLADPTIPNIIPTINKLIKKRDFWMPFAPAVLNEHADRYIKVPTSLSRETISPYMMHSFDTTNQAHEMISAIHPYDNTARAQLVNQSMNVEFHEILSKFYQKTGRSALLNTSFNLHGYPIVMGAKDALMVMRNSEIKHLFVNSHHFFKD